MVCASTWAAGLIGAGLLAAIPGTLLIMLYFGVLARCHRGVPMKVARSWRGRVSLGNS